VSESYATAALAVMMSALLAATPARAQAGSGSSLEAGSGTAHGVETVITSPAPEPKCTRCGERTFGTTVEWAHSVPEAAQRAQAEQKLVFVLHVSGHFETPGYT
jgi:hypothetical protein